MRPTDAEAFEQYTLSQRNDNMAMGPMEIGILVIFGIFLFGAKRIPELARNIGRAKGEFQLGEKEVAAAITIADLDRGGITEAVLSEQE